jgi:hypothetical protein
MPLVKTKTFPTGDSEEALRWMLDRGMISRKTAKDPETYATVQGFILSDQLREMIGSNLIELVAKATARKNGEMSRVSVRDAFLTATMGAVLTTGRVSLRDEDMARCCNIIFALLPVGRLEQAGIAQMQLRTLASNRASLEKLQHLLHVRV